MGHDPVVVTQSEFWFKDREVHNKSSPGGTISMKPLQWVLKNVDVLYDRRSCLLGGKHT
jgi:hypothetical protein